MNMKIGVDLGGTNIRAGLMDGTELIRKEKVSCPAQGSESEVIEAVAGLIGKCYMWMMRRKMKRSISI